MSNLIRLLGRRLIAMPIMVLGVTLLVFIVMSFSSADPARLALGESASLQALENYREAQGLNDPMFVRFFRYLGGLVQFDLGESFTGVPISEMVAENFPKTLQLTSSAWRSPSCSPWSSASSPPSTATAGPTSSSA